MPPPLIRQLTYCCTRSTRSGGTGTITNSSTVVPWESSTVLTLGLPPRPSVHRRGPGRRDGIRGALGRPLPEVHAEEPPAVEAVEAGVDQAVVPDQDVARVGVDDDGGDLGAVDAVDVGR